MESKCYFRADILVDQLAWGHPETTSSFKEERGVPNRGGVWPGKNHKYFIKRKLDIKFQIFFLFNIFIQKFILILKCCIIL